MSVHCSVHIRLGYIWAVQAHFLKTSLFIFQEFKSTFLLFHVKINL